MSDRLGAHDGDDPKGHDGLPKCPRCFHLIRVYRVRVMMGVYLEARIHVYPRGGLIHWGKLNPECRKDEVVLKDNRMD